MEISPVLGRLRRYPSRRSLRRAIRRHHRLPGSCIGLVEEEPGLLCRAFRLLRWLLLLAALAAAAYYLFF